MVSYAIFIMDYKFQWSDENINWQVYNLDGVVFKIYYESLIPVTTAEFELQT